MPRAMLAGSLSSFRQIWHLGNVITRAVYIGYVPMSTANVHICEYFFTRWKIGEVFNRLSIEKAEFKDHIRGRIVEAIFVIPKLLLANSYSSGDMGLCPPSARLAQLLEIEFDVFQVFHAGEFNSIRALRQSAMYKITFPV